MINTAAESEARAARVAEIFNADKAHGSVTVLQDQGAYRHLRATTHGGFLPWFEIATWPGTLIFQGPSGAWTFGRGVDDMAAYVKDTPVNVPYWADLLLHHSNPAYVYAGKDRATQYIWEAVQTAENTFPDLPEAVEATFFAPYASADLDTEDGFLVSASTFEHDDFRFDVQDWDLKIIDSGFAYACHALSWAIDLWAAGKGAATAAVR
ncbi:hypothetical protein OG345_42175 (plasmid) [Streptomyces sp. NBC_01220]|uniref:hypothetical protein n=1 Tax=Streptomyces sp. NBC_01220 TaxID=2903781 RepID=UPI00352BE26F|nr:hypothetical protein OG345_42175 [Streptomyces sp. NBC_01220]